MAPAFFNTKNDTKEASDTIDQTTTKMTTRMAKLLGAKDTVEKPEAVDPNQERATRTSTLARIFDKRDKLSPTTKEFHQETEKTTTRMARLLNTKDAQNKEMVDTPLRTALSDPAEEESTETLDATEAPK